MSSNDIPIPTTNNEYIIKNDANNDENLSSDFNLISTNEQLSQKIDLINFSTAFQDTNTYENKTKSSTTISPTYAEVVRGVELVKRPDTPAENLKENKQTKETQEIPPIVGRIYKLRHSLREVFETHDENSSTGVSSSASSTSSKPLLPKKAQRPNKRPCLVIEKSSQSVNLLIITRFHHLDPTSEELLSQFPRENLLKYVLSIHPTSPLYGRRNVNIISPQSPSYFNPSENAYILLKPLTVSLEQQWPKPLPDYVDNDELLYIRATLFDILMEERNQSIEKTKVITITTEDNNDEDDNITSTSTSTSTSSFPIPRFLQESFGHVDLSLNRSKEIEKWLADVEPSTECVIDLYN